MNKGLSPSRQMEPGHDRTGLGQRRSGDGSGGRALSAWCWCGHPHISWKFLSTTASVLKKTDGILPAILNTLYVIVLTLLIVLPLGVGAAVYLTEYASNRRLIEVIEFTNETLAGIPSIIYGLVGMLVFSQALGFQTCLLSGSA